MKESYYFPHDTNARNDEKILMLRAEHNNHKGYSVYFWLLESMAESSDGKLSKKSIPGLSLSYGLASDELMAIVDFCIQIGLFKSNEDKFYSERMMDHKQFRKERSASGKKGANEKWRRNRLVSSLAMAQPMLNDSSAYAKERKGKENIKTYNPDLKTKSGFNKPFKDNPVIASLCSAFKTKQAAKIGEEPNFNKGAATSGFRKLLKNFSGHEILTRMDIWFKQEDGFYGRRSYRVEDFISNFNGLKEKGEELPQWQKELYEKVKSKSQSKI